MDYGKYPVLYVDDNRSNRVVMQHTLGRDFDLMIAESGSEALELLSTRFFAVLLTDHRMPGMTGVDLAEKSYLNYPDVVRIIITAYSDIETTVDAINRGRVRRFVKKPWTYEELNAVIKESIESYHTAQLIKQMHEQLLSTDRIAALGVMASGIAHDLRQPLSHILPFIGMARSNIKEAMALRPGGRLGELLLELKRDIDDAALGTEMLKMFADSLVDQISERPIVKEPLDIKEVITGAVSIIRFTIAKRAQFNAEMPAGDVWISGCSSRLSQLFINLLLNATHAIAPGAPLDNEITLRLLEDGEIITIEVEDTGHGISEEDLERIFTPLFSTKGGEGSGLGLAICKQSVEAHDGKISVTSQQGSGSCFRVELPKNI